MTNKKIFFALVTAVVWIGVILLSITAADARQSAGEMNVTMDEYIESVGTESYVSEFLDEDEEYPDITLEQDNEDR